jgi:hypothetical protein
LGDWSFKPWGNDDAADWFQWFWKTKNVELIVDEIEHFDPKAERYDQVRAAAYLLETLGNPYVWPAARQGALKPLLAKTIEILSRMIEPPDKDWGFLDMWGNHPGVVEAVREQIATLRTRMAELA